MVSAFVISFPSHLVESLIKNVSSVPCSISSVCFPCFPGRSRQTIRQRFLRHRKIARRFCRLNEKRGQLLEALPFQSSKSSLPSFLASRPCMDARERDCIFPEFFHSRRYHFFFTFPVMTFMVINIEEGETRC